jgi:hypothetical protein
VGHEAYCQYTGHCQALTEPCLPPQTGCGCNGTSGGEGKTETSENCYEVEVLP